MKNPDSLTQHVTDMYSKKGVYDRIQILRGEQFRHAQNLKGSRSHLTSTNVHAIPSLPLRLLSLGSTSRDRSPSPPPSSSDQPKSLEIDEVEGTFSSTTYRLPAGPTPPKSWRLNSLQKDVRRTWSWRNEALSLVLNYVDGVASFQDQGHEGLQYQYHSRGREYGLDHDEDPGQIQGGEEHENQGVPPLTLLCLQYFLKNTTFSEFRDQVVPWIPQHLRKNLVRYLAVHSPPSNARLYALWEEYGNADGEMIIVGPNASLKDDWFKEYVEGNGHDRGQGGGRLPLTSSMVENENESDAKDILDDDAIVGTGEEEEKTWDWDTDDIDSSRPLTTFILLNTDLSSLNFNQLPPTITHLALINISSIIPLRRLWNMCPLLVVLDISYNAWLGDKYAQELRVQSLTSGGSRSKDPYGEVVHNGLAVLSRVNWNKWTHLKVLGYRGNHVPTGFVETVNNGRWDDIEVIL